MPSSVIRQFTYVPERRELHVDFQTGRSYIYLDVPPDTIEAFRAAFSKGRYFNAHIRDSYAVREVTTAA